MKIKNFNKNVNKTKKNMKKVKMNIKIRFKFFKIIIILQRNKVILQ